jgi:hypothetical protein
MMPYHQQVLSAGEISGQDPFGGSGIRLDFPGSPSRAEAAKMTADFLGEVPHVIWDTHAWADGRLLSPERREEIERPWEAASDR